MLFVSPLAETPRDALNAALGFAPYLKRLAARRSETVDRLQAEDASDLISRVIADIEGSGASDFERALRCAKADTHLALTAADLSAHLSLPAITSALSQFADQALGAALATALQRFELSGDGLFVIALGKMGAFELNYSSDIDIAVFYDPERFDAGGRSAGDAAGRVVREAVRSLEQRTEDGYVFRTDLRLRPDPRSTPPAVSVRMAELYYESVGQNWERMVWIKARPCAGDLACASDFVMTLQPFVWRRHLDYWAIADIHAIKRQINAHGAAADLHDPAPDVKLGPGGIREIEFFAQTQQLILGGRDITLRERGTISALNALSKARIVDAEQLDVLTTAYEALRHVEHRLQMMNDEQTHKLPNDPEARARVAALCGAEDLASFDRGVRETRRAVHEIYNDLFADEERRAAAARSGNLVFTGVDDDPGTLETLAGLGFSAPSRVIETVRQWHRGRVPATRTTRGRELLTALLPDLLAAMGETGEAQRAFDRFVVFFEGLRSGVQTLSMLLAEPPLMSDLVLTLALAPRLAETLGRRPDMLESLLSSAPPQPLIIDPSAAFGDAMDAARRQHREQSFLIGHRMLHGLVSCADAAAAWSDLADEAVQAMAAAGEAEMGRKFGPCPGDWVICAMGRLGGRDMTAGSDLDLIVIYEPFDGVDAQQYFARFTQRLISGLSSPTAEGELYDVDMRLRPSGRAGPVAVRFAAFDRYQREEAWTWEHMALTRLRPVAGDEDLGARVVAAARRVLAAARDPASLRADVLAMRERLAAARPGRGLWDLKLAPGGLVDLEFVVQHALLALGDGAALEPETGLAIELLKTRGALSAADAEDLRAGRDLFASLQQILRLAVGDAFDPGEASNGLKRRLVETSNANDFNALTVSLANAKRAVVDIRCKKIGALATD